MKNHQPRSRVVASVLLDRSPVRQARLPARAFELLIRAGAALRTIGKKLALAPQVAIMLI